MTIVVKSETFTSLVSVVTTHHFGIKLVSKLIEFL